ncbi:MAG: hypothetical protein AMJ91_00580 [candidate division Zixibacteria bacterium SM23_73_3]|nr:MAG: hypothetical protein AMJ91_00580 [candidate division Zixibacteria bacterium SM23_73_3]
MKKSNENPSLNCDEIEGLLIQGHFDKITQDQSLLVEEHLESCDRCRSYQKTLSGLQNSMQIDVGDKLTPDTDIRETIIQRMKTVKAQETGIFRSTWQYIRNVFEYRIPVYQPLLGGVLVLLIFFAVRELSFAPDPKSSKLQTFTQVETPILSQMSVIDNLEIIEAQKIGRSVREDTTLTRFIVSTM